MPSFSVPLSGLTSSSEALSAIANNLANLNTVGYKDTQVLFRDLFYQMLGSSGSGDPIQLGAGAAVSAMPSVFTQGSVDPTGVNTDVAIMNDGFFVVQKDGVTSYTRAGNFTVDKDAFLVTSDGQQVLGYPAVNGAIDNSKGLAPLQLGAGTISPPTATTTVQIRTNLDATSATGTSFPAPVTVYDSLGAPHVLTFDFTKTATGWSYQITMPSSDLNPTGNPPAPASGILATGNLTFDGAGNLIAPLDSSGNPLTTIAVTASGLADGANNLTFNWNLFDGTTGVLTQVAAPSSTSSTTQNGSGSGSLASFAIGSDGIVSGAFSNGKTAVLGQLVLATFANQQGLLRTGSNNFSATLASGQAVLGAPGTGGRGTLAGGALELSNVDIAKEFASLIVQQRGYQANARVVTTFDQITQETINLKQ